MSIQTNSKLRISVNFYRYLSIFNHYGFHIQRRCASAFGKYPRKDDTPHATRPRTVQTAPRVSNGVFISKRHRMCALAYRTPEYITFALKTSPLLRRLYMPSSRKKRNGEHNRFFSLSKSVLQEMLFLKTAISGDSIFQRFRGGRTFSEGRHDTRIFFQNDNCRRSQTSTDFRQALIKCSGG